MAGLNPYTPGAGTRPRELAGRDPQIALLRNVAELVEAGREPNPTVYTGLRGMGKTSLLREARDELRQRGWLAGYYEVRRDVEPGVAIRSIVQDGAELTTGKLRKALASGAHTIGGFKLKAGPTGFAFEVEAHPAQGAPDDPYQDLVEFLRRLGGDARSAGVGVAILLDEIQVFRKRDLTVLIQALMAVRDEPIALLGAGLPYLASEMSKSNTYAERFRYEVIGRLSDGDAREALVGPALAQGTTWEKDAIDQLLDVADGYPYFLQLYASEAWQLAGSAPIITVADVTSAIPRVRDQLDVGLYSARYDRLSPGERDYVDAMVAVADASGDAPSRASSGEVARSLQKTPQQLGPIRDRVIRKGIIHAPTAGLIEFSVPGFADYVRRRTRSTP